MDGRLHRFAHRVIHRLCEYQQPLNQSRQKEIRPLPFGADADSGFLMLQRNADHF